MHATINPEEVTREKEIALMRRIITVVVVVLAMAAMMLAMAMPAFAKGGAAANCGPPGQTHSEAAKVPGEPTPVTFEGPPD